MVLDEVRPAGVKTGMLWSGDIIRAVAKALGGERRPALVVDPVLAATAGGDLLRPDALPALQEDLLPQATVITPNLLEAARLLGVPEIGEADLSDAARDLRGLGCDAVLLKGGHGTSTDAVDVLATAEDVIPLGLPRLAGANAHGTGCALAASLAARLARGAPLLEAATGAKRNVYRLVSVEQGHRAAHIECIVPCQA